MQLSRIDRVDRAYTIAATVPGGGPGSLTSVDLALLSPRTTPTGATQWTTVPVVGGVATPTFAGPDADPTSAIVVPATADVWMRWIDGDEVKAVRVERIDVLGGGTLPLPDTLDRLVANLLANPNSLTRAQALTLPTYPNGA